MVTEPVIPREEIAELWSTIALKRFGNGDEPGALIAARAAGVFRHQLPIDWQRRSEGWSTK